MSYIIRMPKMGLEMEEGEVVSWEVDEGESVASGDVIAVVESEKSANDVEAREAGVVRRIIVSEGGVVEPGDPIGIFAEPDEDISELVEEATDGSAEAGEDESSETAEPDADESPASAADSSSSTGSVRATPGAKNLAQERGVDLTEVTGTGPQGTIVESDVAEYEPESAAQSTDTESTASDVQATPGAKNLAQERGVDLTEVTGTGPQGTIVESDVAEYEPESTTAGTESKASDVKATPGAKDLAADSGVNLADVSGSGPQGVVTEADVQDHATSAASETGESPSESVDAEPASRTVRESRELSGIQATVSDRMSESNRNAAHVTLNRSFDAETVSNARQAASREGVDVSVTDILVRAVGAGLAAHPEFNALFEDGEHKLVEEVNIGVAVDVEDGLLTPVVPTVASRSVEETAEIRGELTERALSGDFSMDDLSGGTFTITNLGMFGIDSFDPIINPPEVAILGVGRIRDDGTMTLSLSFDHRVVNGADAARFLDTIVTHLTDPVKLLDLFEADLFERYALEN